MMAEGTFVQLIRREIRYLNRTFLVSDKARS